jgi:hypothetical protein
MKSPTANFIDFYPVLKHGVALLAAILALAIFSTTNLSAQFSGGSGYGGIGR